MMSLVLQSVSKQMIIFSYGMYYLRVLKTLYTKVVILKHNWSFHRIIQTTLLRWFSKQRCGIQIFMMMGKFVFQFCMLQESMRWMIKKQQKRDGGQLLVQNRYLSVWYLCWMTQILIQQQTWMHHYNSEMIAKHITKGLGY